MADRPLSVAMPFRRGLTADVRQREASRRDTNPVCQDLAFDFHDAAHASDDVGPRVQDLVGPGASGELERPNGRDPKHSAGVGSLAVACGGQASGLRQQLDQYDGRDDRVARKVPLKIPVVRMSDAKAAGGQTRHQVGDFLHEPHGRPMRKQIDGGTTCSHEQSRPF